MIWLAAEAAGGSTNPDVLIDFGALFTPFIVAGEYWRLFSALFLHVGLMHLIFNCLGLFIFGQQVETIYGHYRFVTIYLIAGLAGSVSSFSFNNNAVGAGASGAIFGVLGALIAFFVSHRDRLGKSGRQNLTGLLFLAGINLFIGFTIPNVDNLAHIGGFIMGFAIGIPLTPNYQPIRNDWDMLVSYRDANSLPKQWWVIAVAIGLLIVGTTIGILKTTENPFIHIRQSENYLADGKHTPALDEVSEAIRIEPRFGRPYFTRAKILIELGDYSGAVSDLGLALRLGLDGNTQKKAAALIIELNAKMR